MHGGGNTRSHAEIARHGHTRTQWWAGTHGMQLHCQRTHRDCETAAAAAARRIAKRRLAGGGAAAGRGGEGARARRGWARTYRRHARGARPGRSCPRSNREKRPRARGPSRNSRGLLRPSPRRFRALADTVVSVLLLPTRPQCEQAPRQSLLLCLRGRDLGHGVSSSLSLPHTHGRVQSSSCCEGMQRGPNNVWEQAP